MDQCYFSGDFYQATANTNAGESPLTTPSKWSLVKIPAQWRWLLTRLTYAHLLELDGQGDKAEQQRTLALESERIGLTDTVRREANAELKLLGRPSVQTPYNSTSTTTTGLTPLYPGQGGVCKP